MITDEKIKEELLGGNMRVHTLGFTTTERCNIKCAVCYLGEPRHVDIDHAVPDAAFGYFKNVDAVYLGGAESQLNPRGLEHISTAIDANGAKLKRLQFVTNGTFINKPFWEILDKIHAKNKARIYVDISNDEWHKNAVEEKGYGSYKRLIMENYKILREKYPQFDIDLRSYQPYAESYIRPSGRGKDYTNTNLRNLGLGVNFGFADHIDVYRFPIDGVMQTVVDDFQVDAKGNVVQMWRDLDGREQQNFGNILKSPISEIITEHGKAPNTKPEITA